MEKVKIFIDGKEIEAEKDKTILQVALENGISIPYFCYHPKLKIIGACRMCIVYNEKIGRLITSCNTKVEDGMVISTEHPSVRDNQKYLLQAFMTRHPLDCPICDKAGECDLQNYGAIFGPQKQVVPVSALQKERHFLDWESNFLEYYSNRCVVCYRCTRVCDDINGAHALYVEERGFQANIVPTVRPMDTSMCEMCGLCVHVCPVGAILSKPFKFWTRSWLLKKEATVCNVCPVGCEVQVEYGVGDWRSKEKVYRTKPTEDLNICAKTFFGYDVLSANRLLKPRVYGKEESLVQMANFLSSMLENRGDSTAFVLSSYLSNEILYKIRQMATKLGAFVTSPLTVDFFSFLDGYGNYEPLYINDIKDADFYVLVGEDITSTAPALSYYIKGRVYKIGKVERDAKLRPLSAELEDIKKLHGNGVIVVNTTGLSNAREVGKFIKEVSQDRGFKVLLIHRGANFLGVYKIFGDKLSDIGSIWEATGGGRIRNLVVYGEDLLESYRLEEVQSQTSRLENLVVFSPFADGMSRLAKVSIPFSLYGETEGSFQTLLGQKKGRRFLSWSFDDIDFHKQVLKNLPEEEKGIRVLRGKNPEINFAVHLYKSNWITQRSENLRALYEKNVGEFSKL
ncbi:MAG: 2Fe-2S iron-sulfur cluster-binding protein [Aquificaceae bacterium]